MSEKHLIHPVIVASLLLFATSAYADISDSPWGDAADFVAPANSDSQITYGPPGCPIVVVNRDAWHIKTKRIVQTLPVDVEIGKTRCLSANGRYFAAYNGEWHDRGMGVNVWDLVSGEKVAEIPGGQQRVYTVLQFMRNRYLIAANDSDASCLVWDVEENRKVRELPTRVGRIAQGQLSVSPDGQFLALVEGDQVPVMKLAESRYLGSLVSPFLDPTSTRTRSTLGADNIKDMAFSPDGKEIAAIYQTTDKQRLIVWDGVGQIQFDIPVNIYWGRLNSQSLTWLPNKKGWIVDGNVIHRDSKKIVTQVKRDRYAEDKIGALDEYYMIGRFGQAADSISVIGIPWEEIERSIGAMSSADNPIIGPGVQVSIMVYMRGQTGESIETARAAIGDALVARLAEDQMTFAPDQEAYFRFNAEPASADHQFGLLKLELLVKGSDTPIWTHEFAEADSKRFLQGLDTGSISETAILQLKREINLLQIPYFIPRTADFMPLPMVIQ